MKRMVSFALVLLTTNILMAQQDFQRIELWPAGPPNDNGITTPEEQFTEGRIGNVSKPEMLVYPADKGKNTGAAVIICPGGGYSRLAFVHEGTQFAQWLSANGITGIVLKYRMPNGRHDVPLSDAAEAVRVAKAEAGEWDFESHKVGIMGFSAGGHLASTLLTHFDEGSRPDFGVLFYPVISYEPQYSHTGSVVRLLGENPSQDMINLYSNEKQIKENTPPTLIFFSDDDKTVPPVNGALFYAALKEKKVPAAFYVYPAGGHGWGFRDGFPYHEDMKIKILEWIARCAK